MKRTNFITNLISILLFAAMLAYLGFSVYGQIKSNLRTAPAIYVELFDSVPVEGIIVREERLITSSENYISVSAENGQLVGTGETVAMAFSGEAALERANRIRELELQQRYIKAALEGSSTDKEIARRDASIKSSVTSLTAAAARGELDLAAEAAVTLASLVMDNPDIYVSEIDLELVTSELNSLKSAAGSDTKAIEAPVSGLFFASADGFEHLIPDNLAGLTVPRLTEMKDSIQEIPENVIGKIIDPLEWYYAAVVPYETARRLEVGKSAALDFGRYCSQPLQARVVEIRYDQDKDCSVVFRCTESAAELLYARNVSAEIVFDSISGIRVPVEAVYQEEAEEKNEDTGLMEMVTKNYIFTVTGLQAEKKYINIIWESADYYLAEISAKDPASLREGNEIILTGREIYDGMLLERTT